MGPAMKARDPIGQLAQTGIKGVQTGLKGVKRAGRLVDPRRLSGLFHKKIPGGAPGIAPGQLSTEAAAEEPARVTCIDYGPGQCRIMEVSDGHEFLAPPRPDWAVVRWLNVDGLTDRPLIGRLAEHYDLHPLSVEDMLHVPQRPKVEVFQGSGESRAAGAVEVGGPTVFVVTQMVRIVEGKAFAEQVSLFLKPGLVLTFQETRGDVWDPIRQRIERANSKLRANDASYLLYALLDAIVDHHFPMLESFGDRLEEIEMQLLERPHPDLIGRVHAIRRELLMLRREVWPLREVVSSLQRDDQADLSDATRTYLRDVHDHAIQIADIVETYREVAGGLAETYMTLMGNRMNEVMKVLTIFATIFIPITFLAGVYGMNFDYFPELHQRWAYPTFWGICVATAGGMLVWFRRKQWL